MKRFPHNPERDDTPLGIDELNEALADIQRRMKGYKGEPLTPTSSAEILRYMNGLDEADQEDALQTMGMTRMGFDQLCVLQHDLVYHTGIDTSAVVERKEKQDDERQPKAGESDSEEAEETEPTENDILTFASHGITSVRTQIATLLSETPNATVTKINAILREFRRVTDTIFDDIQHAYGVDATLILEWKKRPLERLRRMPLAVQNIDCILKMQKERFDAYFQDLYVAEGLTRETFNRWRLFSEEHPTALKEEISRERSDTKKSREEQEALMDREIPLHHHAPKPTNTPQTEAPPPRKPRARPGRRKSN